MCGWVWCCINNSNLVGQWQIPWNLVYTVQCINCLIEQHQCWIKMQCSFVWWLQFLSVFIFSWYICAKKTLLLLSHCKVLYLSGLQQSFSCQTCYLIESISASGKDRTIQCNVVSNSLALQCNLLWHKMGHLKNLLNQSFKIGEYTCKILAFTKLGFIKHWVNQQSLSCAW